jgi:hypothetical protein
VRVCLFTIGKRRRASLQGVQNKQFKPFLRISKELLGWMQRTDKKNAGENPASDCAYPTSNK